MPLRVKLSNVLYHTWPLGAAGHSRAAGGVVVADQRCRAGVPWRLAPLGGLQAASGILCLLEILVAGALELLDAAVQMPFDFAVGLRLAPAPFAFIIQGSSGVFLHVREAHVRRQRWHTPAPLVLNPPDAPALVKHGAAVLSMVSIGY
jgi:hypothetical protein